jgi:hypothetical protein
MSRLDSPRGSSVIASSDAVDPAELFATDQHRQTGFWLCQGALSGANKNAHRLLVTCALANLFIPPSAPRPRGTVRPHRAINPTQPSNPPAQPQSRRISGNGHSQFDPS